MDDDGMVPLDEHRMFFLSTFTEGGQVRSYSIHVEKAEDSHYTFSPAAMDTLDRYLATKYTGTTLVDRLTQFIASYRSAFAAERELQELNDRLGLGVRQIPFDSYD